MYDYGFIGTGNMGSALAQSLPEGLSLAFSNRTFKKAEDLANMIGGTATMNGEIALNSRFIILGVKPQSMSALLSSIRTEFLRNQYKPVIVTMAAGIKTERICELLGGNYPVIRIMPNTPVAICKGVLLCSKNEAVSDVDYAKFMSDFGRCGTIIDISEEQIDSAGVISGCGPAYTYMYIDALAKAGEDLGLDYDLAVSLACATAEGSAALSVASDRTLEDLRIAVCSPGGSTIEGVKSLQDSDFDGAVLAALKKAYIRTKELSGEN